MRIAQLSLLAYGPFRDLDLDLSAPGLHVVFGRNEAGKSTTLRAITGLLYGIDARTRDAHVHKPADLRIGGTLIGADGARVRIVRRKGNTNTLLDDKGQPIDDAVLLRLLRGVSEETWKSAFGLDHETLARGAQALLEGRGDVGGSLFDASVGGGTDAQKLLAELEAEAEALYKPRASAPALNAALKAFELAQKDVKEKQSLPEAYVKQRDALEETKAQRASVAARRNALVTTRARLARTKARLPLVRRKAQILASLAELGPVTSQGGRIASLQQRLGAYESAERDARALATEAELLRGRVTEAARRAGVVLDDGGVAARLDARTEERMRRLLAERTKTEEKVSVARAEIERCERELARQQALATSGVTLDEPALARLARALERARSLGDAAARQANEAAKVSKRAAEVEARVAALRAFVRPVSELVAMKLPANETIDRLAARAADLDRIVARHTQRVEHLDAEERSVARHIAEQSGDFAPPTKDELRAVRGARDAAWARFRAAKATGAAELASLELELDRALRDADGVADRMIVEADRVTMLARLRAQAATLAHEREVAAADLARARDERAALDSEHAATWAPAGVEPLGFAEMRAWLDRHAHVVDAHARLREAEAEQDDVARAIASAHAELASTLAALGEASGRDASLGELMPLAATRLDAVESARRTSAEAARAAAKLEAQLDERRASALRDEATLSEVTAKVAELAAPLGLNADASGDEVTRTLDAARDLFTLEDKRAEVAARARLAADDARAFEEDVRRAAVELAADVAGATPREIVATLAERSQRAHACEHQLADIDAHLVELGDAEGDDAASHGEDLEAVKRALEDTEAELADVERDLSRLDHTIGGIESGLEKMRADSGAADAAASAQEALARVRAAAERYLRAKVAAVVLAREIERYREQHQGPLIAAASQLFARLTLGRYSGVRAGFDEKDRPSLRCVRGGNVEVDVIGLSEGTRDQLYLSLRLASLLRHAETAEAMPLVLDDVLIQFDDERSRAALSVLADVAARMQVLFFTHHARVVELAREAVASDALTVHELSAPATAALLTASP